MTGLNTVQLEARALVQRAYGEPGDVLRLETVPTEAPGADEVTIRMEAAAVHIADVRTVHGVEGFRRPLPRTPGYEGIGRVLAVGSEVRHLRPGDRVFPPIGAGTFREVVRVRAAQAVSAPEGDARQLAFMTINPPTALFLLEDFAPLRPGDWVLQNAANSSVGRYLIALARLRGIRTINVVRRESLMAELETAGADLVLLDNDDLPDQVAEATGGADIRLGIDAVGGAATARIAACLGDGALVVNYGSMSHEPCHMPFELMFRRDVRLVGFSTTRQFEKRDPVDRARLVRDLARLACEGTLHAKIAAVYTLETATAALEHALFTGAERDGKIVLSME
jgi:NADPH:quinone reductase-like Zn-dependent oxidoreductase